MHFFGGTVKGLGSATIQGENNIMLL